MPRAALSGRRSAQNARNARAPFGGFGRETTAGLLNRLEELTRHSLGRLGFPRGWPQVYYENKALRSLIGKKGLCPAGRVAVVGPTQEEDLALVGCGQVLPWQGRVNAQRLATTIGSLQAVQGWALFERLDLPASSAFVALRYAWNALPDGRWVDFT
ncbi:unnamed protein product, partial [Effrenium voratum]